MAQTTLNPPQTNEKHWNNRPDDVEGGDTAKTFIDKVQAMFTELYGLVVAPTSDPTTVSGIGAAAGTGVTVVETGDGAVHKTVLTFTNVAMALTDVAATVAYVGLKVYDFPEGFISFMGASANLALTKSSAGVNADWDGDFGLGTVTASNNATLSSTEQDLIPSTATPQAVAGATTATGVSTATEAPKILDGHTTAKDAYLNILVDDADQDVTGTPCNIIVNGTITLIWANLGDYT